MLDPIRGDTPVMPVDWPTRSSDPGPSVWLIREEALLRARKDDLPRVVSIRVNHYRGRPLARYAVVIRGRQLRPGPVPVMVQVGGELLIEPLFALDGRTLNGRLRRRPRNRRVVLDYGFAVLDEQIPLGPYLSFIVRDFLFRLRDFLSNTIRR